MMGATIKIMLMTVMLMVVETLGVGCGAGVVVVVDNKNGLWYTSLWPFKSLKAFNLASAPLNFAVKFLLIVVAVHVCF